MGTKTAIEWTDATWNPVRGCSRVSEGCRNCYAERVAYRFSEPGLPYAGLAVLKNGHASWTGEIKFVEEHLLDPLKWGPAIEHHELCELSATAQKAKKLKRLPCSTFGLCATRSRRIFVNSMSDLFHENVTDEMRDRIFAVMALCPQHVFQVLTKRPERMLGYLHAPEIRKRIARDANLLMRSNRRAANSDALSNVFLWGRLENVEVGEYVNHLCGIADRCWPLPNVWLGVSVENQAAADERIPLLLETPAAGRFLSCEPLLGEVVVERILNPIRGDYPGGRGAMYIEPLRGYSDNGSRTKLDWVICGGESGPNARPMHPHWARTLRDQCQAAGVPFFFKQWGEWGPLHQNRGLGWKFGDPRTGYWSQDGPGLYEWNHMGVASYGEHMLMVGKKAAGALLDGVEWKQFPEARA